MSPTKFRRPFSVTLLAWLVFIVALLNLLRLVLTLTRWQFLVELLPFSPAYLAVSGWIWFLIGLPVAWGMMRGKHWAPGFTLAIFLAYSIYYWLDRLLLPGYPERKSDWPFVAGLNLVILLGSFYVLYCPKGRRFFGEVDERRKPELET